ncbi:MAG: ABC transporter ATP-binding protein [Sporolactobacillus sp.]
METVMNVNQLCKRFKNFRLKAIDFQIKKGTITGFVGPNGSGKTTTIKCLLNLIHPDSGSITILGLDSIRQEREIKDQLGIVLDVGYYYEDLTFNEMKKLIVPIYSAWDDKTYQDYLQKFDLPADRKIKDLSKGMRMKYSILLAISHHAKLFIMDEPTSGLDPLVRSDLVDILKDLIQDGEKSVFFSTHITSDLDKVADDLIFLLDGQIFLHGEKDEIKNHHIIVKGSNELLNEDIEKYFIGIHKTPYGMEGLSNDRAAVKRLLKDNAAYEVPTIEDLLLYYTRRRIK